MSFSTISEGSRSEYLLPAVLALAFYTAFIPHQSYPYPVHLDEWLQMAFSQQIIAHGRATGITDPFTGGVVHGNQVFEVGSLLFWTVLHQVSDISWMIIFRFFPGVISVLIAFFAYILGRRWDFGLEAALFTCLIPTTVGLLGPAFLVPIALGFLFILLALFFALHFTTVWGYLLLFLLTCTLVMIHPPTGISLVIILIPFVLLNAKADPKRSLFISLAVAVPFLLPFPWIFEQLLPNFKALFQNQSLLNYVALPEILPTYGYLPFIATIVGIFALAMKGSRSAYGLLLGLLALVFMLVVFNVFHHGNVHVYYRGLMVAMLMMSLVAGAGLHWTRRLALSQGLSTRLKLPFIGRNLGAFLAVAFVGVMLAVVIPARQGARYYQMIDENDYQAFVWIRDKVGSDYDTAVMDPWKGVPFTAITGKYAYARIYGLPTPNSDKAARFLNGGCTDTSFLINNSISIVYATGPVNNPDLDEVRANVYLLKSAQAVP